MTPMMARVLSQALVLVVGGSSLVSGAGQAQGALPEREESHPEPEFEYPTDTDYYYDKAGDPQATAQKVPDPLQRQNSTGPTDLPHNSSSPPNLSGAPQSGSNLTAAGDFGHKVVEPTWYSAWWYPTWARDPSILEFYQTSMIYLWVEHHQSVGVALCLCILSSMYTFLAACCRRGRLVGPPEPIPTAPPGPSLGQTFVPAGRGARE